MRFVEDQFVVWGEHPEWNYIFGPKPRYYPAGLEQYDCYAPIDGSTATIMTAFANMLVPEGNIKKYVSLATGFMIIITAISILPGGIDEFTFQESSF